LRPPSTGCRLPVKSSPGFLGTVRLTPYMLEAMVLLDENFDKRVIDEAAKVRHDEGPIERADQVGAISGRGGECCVGNSAVSPADAAVCARRVAKGGSAARRQGGLYLGKDGRPKGAGPVSAHAVARR